jgi:hypothetical protein
MVGTPDLRDFLGVPFDQIPKAVLDAAEEAGTITDFAVNDISGHPNQGQLEPLSINLGGGEPPSPPPVQTIPPQVNNTAQPGGDENIVTVPPNSPIPNTNDNDTINIDDDEIGSPNTIGTPRTPVQSGGPGGEFDTNPSQTELSESFSVDEGDESPTNSSSSSSSSSNKPGTTVQSAKSAASKKTRGKGAGLQADLNVKIDPRPNELDNFSSYTYNVALYMLKPKDYVKMLKAPKNVAQAAKALLMRQGGTGGDRELAEEFQNTEFFIDDLTFDNIGSNPSTRTGNTNAINIKFAIVEPNGCTLIERLKKQSELSLEEEQSYLHTPYLLEVKFKGYDELGKPSNNVVTPKYIPIKMQKLSFSIDATGTNYRVIAVPYHHDVFSSLRATIPVNVQVSAGSVGDILAGAAQAFKTETTRIPDDSEDATDEDFITQTKDVLGEKAISLPEAVNNHYKAQTRPSKVKDPKTKKEVTVPASAEIAERWVFNVADDIMDSKLIGSSIDALNTTQKTKNVYQQYGSVMKGKVNLTKDKKLFKINAGTSVVNLINYIIVASSYLKDNIKPLNQAAANKTETDTPIKWFKVNPQITDFIGWDKKQGKYKFEITWTVQTAGVFYNDYPWAPNTKPKGEGVHKIYDYIFTGENKHVLNCRLDFNMAYYQAVQMGTGNPVSDKTPNTLSPQIKEVPQSPHGQNIANDETVEDKRAKDLMGTILDDGTDMQMLNLDIIGDPAFLPTGDSFFQAQGNDNTVYSTPFMPDGTINYDLTPPYIQLNFKTPTDYDDLTGFADPNINKKYGTSEFNGVYQVHKISNSMSGGVFTQSISATRTKMQPIAGKIARSKESLENRERKQFALDTQNQSLLTLLPLLGGATSGLIPNGISAKLTNAANSSITNIATNAIPKLGQELNQTATNVVSEIQQAGNQMRDFFNTQFTERDATETDTQSGFDDDNIGL